MKLIVGLGNPGERYKNNRHNVGYILVDELKKRGTKGLKNAVAVKTGTFMNNSGEFVERLISQHSNISISDDLYIVHDDLDIRLGDYKIQFGKGPKEHKGLVSIDKALGNSEYWHVRIGVDNRDPENRISGEDYVLQDFTLEEKVILGGVIDKVVKDLYGRFKG